MILKRYVCMLFKVKNLVLGKLIFLNLYVWVMLNRELILDGFVR